MNESGLVCRTRSQRLLTELGTIDRLKTANKIYCASDGVTNSYGVLQVSDLPMACGNGKRSNATIFIGDNLEDNKPEQQLLFIRTDGSARMDVYVNDLKLGEVLPDYAEKFDRLHGIKKGEEMFAFELPKNCLVQGENIVSIVSKSSIFVVKRLEVALNYGDVSSHGYF